MLKELKQLFKDRALFAYTVFIFTLDVVLAAGASSIELQRAPLAVVGAQHSEAGRELIGRFRPPYFEIHRQIGDAREASTLDDAATLAHALAAQQGALTTGIADAARAGEQLEPTLERIATSAQAVERMADAAGAASGRAGRAADAAASGVQQFNAETLPDLARLMAQLDRLSASLRQLSDQTARSPNSLVVGSPARRPGPGESAMP